MSSPRLLQPCLYLSSCQFLDLKWHLLFLLTLVRISQNHITSLDRITALQLLPIAATIVAAGAGAEVAGILPNQQHALGTLLVSFVLWGMGTPLAIMVLVIYYQRLAVHKLPPREMIVSCFLPLGPLGFGGFGYVDVLYGIHSRREYC